MSPAGTVSPRRCVWAWSLGLLLGVPGCTICPDPFDYSGPVPNGSAPHNDFRARSNGIAPTGGVSRPWPPVVQAAPQRSDEPRVAATTPEPDAITVPDSSDGVIQPTAAETPATHDTGSPPEAPVADAPALTAAPMIDAAAAPTDAPAIEATPTIDDILPPAQPFQPGNRTPVNETPGWRPRD